MNRFLYSRDPLFVLSCALYGLNRWFLKPHLAAPFLHSWFNDVLLIPCALPPLLLLHRWLGWRAHDAPPTLLEIASHWAGWSLLFEVIGPRLMPHATGDFWDVVAYAAGAVIAAAWWHRNRLAQCLVHSLPRNDEL